MSIYVFSQGHCEHAQQHRTDQCSGRVIGEEMPSTRSPLESGMGLVLPPIEAYQVHHLPIVKAYADKMGLVEVIHQWVPTEMAIDPGTM